MIADTSLMAYDEVRDSPVVHTQQGLILAALDAGDELTNNELSKRTGVRVSSICGRTNTLLKMCLIQHGNPRPCSITGKTCQTWRKR